MLKIVNWKTYDEKIRYLNIVNQTVQVIVLIINTFLLGNIIP